MSDSSYVSYEIQEDDIYSEDGEVVGSDEYMLIEKVFVPKKDRGLGLGRKLMIDTISEIKADYDGDIKLAALPFDDGIEMADLVEFYESLGFSVESTEGHAVVMILD